MSTNKSSSTKGVNRARKANGKNNKTRSPPTQVVVVQAPRPRKQKRQSNEVPIAFGKSFSNNSKMSHHVPFHRELIGPLTSQTQIGLQTQYRLRCNPASESTFKWLSKMAVLYESYRFRRLRFVAITRCPTSSTGSLLMSPDYDAVDGDIPVTEQFIFNNYGSTESPVWKEQVVLELKPELMNKLYKAHTCMTDERFSTTKQDQKTIDVAQVFICNDTTLAAGTNFGKLIVEYELDFYNPQAPTEPLNEGGARGVVGTNLNSSNQVLPFSAGGLTNKLTQQDEVPVFYPETGNNDASANAVLGRFLRDWEGIVSVQQQGTGMSTFGNVQVGKTWGQADLADDVVQPITIPAMGTSTISSASYYVKALANDYLKLKADAQTTLTVVRAICGGASFL